MKIFPKGIRPTTGIFCGCICVLKTSSQNDSILLIHLSFTVDSFTCFGYIFKAVGCKSSCDPKATQAFVLQLGSSFFFRTYDSKDFTAPQRENHQSLCRHISTLTGQGKLNLPWGLDEFDRKLKNNQGTTTGNFYMRSPPKRTILDENLQK